MTLQHKFLGACFTPDPAPGSMHELARQLPTSFITSTSSAGVSQGEFESEGVTRTLSALPLARRGFSYFFRRSSVEYDSKLRSREEQPKSDSSILRINARSSRNSDLSSSRRSSIFGRRNPDPTLYRDDEEESSDMPPWHSAFKPIPTTAVIEKELSPTSSSFDIAQPVETQDVGSQGMNRVRYEIPRPTSVKDEEEEISFIREIVNVESIELQPPAITPRRRVSLNVSFDDEGDEGSPSIQPNLAAVGRRASISTADDPELKARYSSNRPRSPMSPRRVSISTPEWAGNRSRRLSTRGDSSSRPGKSKSARSSLECKRSSSRRRPSLSGGILDLPQRRYTESDSTQIPRSFARTRTFFGARRRRSVLRDRAQSDADPNQRARETFARSRNLALIWRTNASAGGGMHALDAFQRALAFANDTRGLGRLLRALCATLPEDTPGLHRDSLWRAADLSANFVLSGRHVRPLPLYTTTNRFIARAPFGDALALVTVAASAHGSLGVRRLVRRTSRARRLVVSLTLRNSRTNIRIDVAERCCGAEKVDITIVSGNLPLRTQRRDLVASLRGSLAYLGIDGVEAKAKYYSRVNM